LAAALEWHVTNHNKSSSAQCSLHIDLGDLSFSKEFNTAIYRITQEALTNISRHAEASKAWIDLLIEDDTLLLQIRDNGKGINPKQAVKSNSLGMFSMRERIRPWNGVFDLQGKPKQGSVLRVTFKLNHLKTAVQQPISTTESP
jgi:signal transduction histidine kinase